MTSTENLDFSGNEKVPSEHGSPLLRRLLEQLRTAGPRKLSDDEMLELYTELMAQIEGTAAPGGDSVALLKSGQRRLDRATAQVLEKGEPDPIRRMLRVVRTELQARSFQRLAEHGLLQ